MFMIKKKKKTEELLFTEQRSCWVSIFSGNCEKYCSVVVITIMFLCFDVEV